MTDISEIDPAALTRLDRLGGPGFAQRIIGIFLAECPRRLADAREALARHDAEALAHAAHAIISSAGNIGAAGLAEFARVTEEVVEAGDWDSLPERIHRLETAFGRIRATLEIERGNVP